MSGSADMKPLKIAAAAKAAGVNVQTLHYYEKRGLLRPSRIGSGGYRSYGEAELTLVRGIKRAQALGFSLSEIEDLLELSNQAPERARHLANAKLVELDQKIRDLMTIRSALGEIVESCRCGGDLSKCQMFETLGGEEGEKPS